MAARFRAAGYDAQTARHVSPLLDFEGVDLVGTYPFQVQCKASEKLGSHHTILESMPDDNPLIVSILAHKRNRQGTTITMWVDDFFELIKK